MSKIIVLAASSGKHNVSSSIYLSICLSRLFFTLIRHTAHTQRGSPGGSMLHGQRAFLSEY